MRIPLPKLNYANVIATIALFVALGGAAVAAGLPKNSVGTKQLKRGAVKTVDLRRGAVTSGKIRPEAVTAGKIAPKAVVAGKLGANAVLPGNLGNGIISAAKLSDGAVIASKIRNGVITTNKLDNDAVTTAKLAPRAVTTPLLADGSVTLGKLGSEVAPLLGTLRTGQTLRGVFDLGGEVKFDRQGISFQFPLASAPTAPVANILTAGASSAACPGLKGGGQQTPEAAPGQLCVYIAGQQGVAPELAFDAGTVSRLGFGLLAGFGTATPANQIHGFWAVTAP
jgi:hypothetical protein